MSTDSHRDRMGAGPIDAAAVDPVVRQVSRVLSAGTVAIIALVATGTVLALVAGRRPVVEPGPALDLPRLIGDVVAFRPEGILWLGLLLGLVLPTARTAVALVGFARTRDLRAALVAAGVLAALAVSALVALLTA